MGLLKDGKVVVGVMGCPNLPVDPKSPQGEKGVIFVAVEGQGAFQVRFYILSTRSTRFTHTGGMHDAEITFVTHAHSDHDD